MSELEISLILFYVFLFSIPVVVFIIFAITRIINKKLCKRKGHKYYDKKIKIRKRAGLDYYRAVCVDYKCIIPTCKRCGHTKKPMRLKEIDWYTSVSMPSNMWEEMDEKGYLILN